MKRRIYKDGKFFEIQDPQDLADTVFENLQYYLENMKEAKEKAAMTREEVAKEIKNEYAAENASLKQELKFAIASVSSEKELEDYNNFVNEHLVCRQTKATGGALPIISQYATGIGICTKLTCPVCGAEQDITDTSVW